jgi:hypothetical protein
MVNQKIRDACVNLLRSETSESDGEWDFVIRDVRAARRRFRINFNSVRKLVTIIRG